MFTGIIESIGKIAKMEKRGGDVRLHIATGKLDLQMWPWAIALL